MQATKLLLPGYVERWVLVITTWALFSKPFPNTKGIIDRNDGRKYGNKFQVHERDYHSIISQLQTTWAFSTPQPPQAENSDTLKSRVQAQMALKVQRSTLSAACARLCKQNPFQHFERLTFSEQIRAPSKKGKKVGGLTPVRKLTHKFSSVFTPKKRYEDATSFSKSESLCPDDVTTSGAVSQPVNAVPLCPGRDAVKKKRP